ncbi:MAG: indole-3-glycerol-phosphate synthase [Candidatus Odinarchaeia archaeon]
MSDYLDLLAENAWKLVETGYYDVKHYPLPHLSLKHTIVSVNRKLTPIIAEIKPASPSAGMIKRVINVQRIAEAMHKGGCAAISIITEPNHFKGSLRNIVLVKRKLTVPVLFKDIVVSPSQIEAAYRIGADAVLLIKQIFTRGYYAGTLEDAVKLAHTYGLEVLLETHNSEEFEAALKSEVDLVGVNCRDFRTLKTDVEKSVKILEKAGETDKIVVCESGIKTVEDIRKLKKAGGKAFLIGTSIIQSKNIEQQVRRFAECK